MHLEDFLKAHQFTIAALGVLGTFSAVVVALATTFVATRASRTRIRARASINTVHHSTLAGEEMPQYLAVSIQNLGVMPVLIPLSFFNWKLPFARRFLMIIPLDYSQTDEWIAQKRYPFEIKPRSSEIFFLSDIAMFREYAQKDIVGGTIWSRLRSLFLRARVFTDDSKRFKVVFDKSLQKELARLRNKTTKAAIPPY
jgi:hypothetical protein